MPPLSELGEMPAVQDHFQTVLKRRLQIEIDQNPPLFPWESDLQEYPLDIATAASYTWLAQLRSLRLPTALPEDVLSNLLSRCQALVSESLQPGIQLVKAVETLFPDHPQAVNQIAGLVLANAAVRSAATRDVEALQAAFPEGYEGANPQQQVTLAMLAAKDILDALIIPVTAKMPPVQREWLTTEGKITLTVRCQDGNPKQINLAVDLPQASQLSLPSLGQTVTQNHAGTINLTLPDPQSGAVYPLEIHFGDLDLMPLTFAIRYMETAE
ncbi:MAG: PatU [Leptolyngbya sp. SIO1D8]|nr:PatU [Leptolyngbya sp. SIO1D8]